MRSVFTKAAQLVLVIGLSVLVLNCGRRHRHYDPYLPAWYDVYGQVCSYSNPGPGCNFYFDGTKIVDFEDPYYSGYYFLEFGAWLYWDSYGFERYYEGWGWLSPTGVLYDDWGFALNQKGNDRGHDLIAEAEEAEANKIEAAGKALAEANGLSEDTGIQMADNLNAWASLSFKQKRARSDKDIADFSKRLFGITVEEATAALTEAQQGKLGQLESLNDKVAGFWNTNPETSKAILSKWYKKEIDEYYNNR